MPDQDDDVEVLYDIPYGSSNNNNNIIKQNKGSRGGRSNISNGVRSNGNNNPGEFIGNSVDFENVFDPFERDQDDVGEFFDEDISEEEIHDWEKPNMFNDPRKVRDVTYVNSTVE